MTLIIKYLKKSWMTVMIILILLGIQAYCDLGLPQYTSNIVNIGIQQGGIESPVPEVIRKDELEKLMYFMKEEDYNFLLEHYNFINSEENSNYKELGDLERYELSIVKKEDYKKLEEIIAKPMMILSFASSNQNMMESMPSKEEDFTNEIDSLSESIINQAAISYLSNEYSEMGLNTNSIQTHYILTIGVKMLAYAFLIMIVSIAVAFFSSRVAGKLSKELRSSIFERVLSFSSGEFDTFSTASLITRSTNDIQQVQMLIVMVLRMLLYAPMMGVGGVLKVLSTNTSMTWIIAVAVAAILLVVGFMFFVVMPKFKSMQKLIDRLNLVMREILTGLPVIRAFSTERYEEKRFEGANKDLMKTNLFVNRIMSCMMPVMMLIMNLVTVCIIWFGGRGIDAGQMQVGDMMAFIQYTMQIIMSFLMISMMSIMLPRAAVSLKRIDEVLKVESSILDKEQVTFMQSNKKGLVEFDHVSFCYPGADEEVLKDITFTAKPGETTAIIGSTGCGKSTMINLIPRFFDVTKGSIKVDGEDVRKVSQKELRDKIGYVPQKGILFTGTIESNIKYADNKINDEQMRKAAQIAQAIEFIETKPDKYQTAIAQGGTNVSGGQKQRISIARAIAKNPEIYIFDDSFSALDYKTDVALRKALKEETKESTVIIVAQRISTILHANQILVLDDGELVGRGTHEELMKTCEVYQQIAFSQLSESELEQTNRKEEL